MDDNLSFVVAVILAVLLLVFFPLYNAFERQDDISYEVALKVVTNFADKVRQTGCITKDDYDKFVSELITTGNTYDIKIEAHRKMLNRVNNDVVAENYEIDYNRDIFKELNKKFIDNPKSAIKSEAYLLEEGDYFYVKVKNTNVTQATMIFGIIAGIRNPVKINLSYGGLVTNNEWKDADVEFETDLNTQKSDIIWQKTLKGSQVNVGGEPGEYNFAAPEITRVATNFKIEFVAEPFAETVDMRQSMFEDESLLKPIRTLIQPSPLKGARAGLGVALGNNGIAVIQRNLDKPIYSALIYHKANLSGRHKYTIVVKDNTPYLYIDDKFVKVGDKSQFTLYSGTADGIGKDFFGAFKGKLYEISVSKI